MAKVFKILGLFFLAITFVFGPGNVADAAKKKKIPKKPSYVGPVKCNGSCHDPYYQAWAKTPHGTAFESLKAGVKGDEKKKAGLDPEKDYTADPQCLRCHTNGYKQTGGFKPVGSKSKKTGKSTATKIDPEEPNKEQVGCEMCHSAAGGAQFRVVMKNTKGDFKKAETEKYGQRWDYANVCTRCHNHPQNPFNEKVDKKYAFDYEAKKGQVHDIAKFWNEDNEDQKLEKVEDRAKEKSKSEETPLVIENFSVKDGKLKFKKGTKPYSTKKKTFNYQK
ncbi:MAG: cytochrome c family protein [Nitrospinales bacterium]